MDHAYGGGLIGDQSNRMTFFGTYEPAWVGEYAGYNVMVDIGIFIGEHLIAKRPKLYWEIYRGHRDDDGEMSGPNLKRPQLGGFPRGWGDDVLGLGYEVIAGSRTRPHIGHSPNVGDPDGMIKQCKTSLRLANVPDDGTPFIFGDYSNEPI
jgi:hypothetical protein